VAVPGTHDNRDIPDWSAHLPAGRAFDPAELVADGSLVAAFARRCAREPSRPIVLDARVGWVRAGALDERTRVVAGRLHRAGLARGDRVILSGRNSVDLVVAHLACLRLGAVVVPANAAYREREVAHIARDCTPTFAIVDDPSWRAWLRVDGVDPVVTTSAVELPDAAAPALDSVGPDDPALIGYTSGTTGAPKGAVLSHGNVLAGAAAVRLAWRWVADDRLVLCLPLFHMHGLGVGLHGSLLAGGSIVLLEAFDVDGVLDAARDHHATLFFGVPTMYHRLAASARASELASLRLCVSGSAALPAALHESLQQRAGVRVLERYGMTETVMLVSNPYDGERRPGTVGLPLPGVELRLASTRGDGDDDDDGDGDGDGAGHIEVRGPNVFSGYWNRPDATAASFTPDGWFRTGDLGRRDPDGYLRIVGRSKELIISGGFNVYPREVEDVLGTHPAFAEVAVAGRPSPEWGEEVTAFVVLRPGADAPSIDAVREWARADLAPYKLPRALVVLDALPRNALGKVVKGQLPVDVVR
jgi:malonyl-CoA/methylmalonyl-CoA synthetase